MGNPGVHGAAVGGGADSGDDQPPRHRPRRPHVDLPAGGRIAAFQTLEPFATGHVSWPQSSVEVLSLVPGRFPVTSGTRLAAFCMFLHLFAYFFIYLHLFFIYFLFSVAFSLLMASTNIGIYHMYDGTLSWQRKQLLKTAG